MFIFNTLFYPWKNMTTTLYRWSAKAFLYLACGRIKQRTKMVNIDNKIIVKKTPVLDIFLKSMSFTTAIKRQNQLINCRLVFTGTFYVSSGDRVGVICDLLIRNYSSHTNRVTILHRKLQQPLITLRGGIKRLHVQMYTENVVRRSSANQTHFEARTEHEKN